MSKNKTVLIITSHYPPNIGGVETHLQALVSALSKRKWRVLIATYQPLASPKAAPRIENHKNLVIYRFPWFGLNIIHKLWPYPALEFLYLFPGLFIISALTLLRHHREISIIHCQGLVPTAVGVVLKLFFPKRLISSTHNLYFFPKTGLYPIVAKIIFSNADKVLVATKLAKIELMEIKVGESKIGFFRYWIDLKRFSPIKKSQARSKLKWEKFVCLFVGRLIETKGVKVLLETVKYLDQGIQIMIAGVGVLASEVKNLANKYPDRLNYLGRIENQSLPLYYSGADVIVVPSLVDEGWGFVVMEALSCGTPVVAANKGGLSDAVSPSTGRLISPTPGKIRQEIEFFFKSKTKLKEFQKNCRKYALKNFSEKNVEDILGYYDGKD